MSHSTFIIRNKTTGQTLVEYNEASFRSSGGCEAHASAYEALREAPRGPSPATTSSPLEDAVRPYSELLAFIAGAQAESYHFFGRCAQGGGGGAPTRGPAGHGSGASGAGWPLQLQPFTADSSTNLNSSEWHLDGDSDGDGDDNDDARPGSAEGGGVAAPPAKRPRAERQGGATGRQQ